MNVQELKLYKGTLYQYLKGQGYYRIAVLETEEEAEVLKEILESDQEFTVSYAEEAENPDVLFYIADAALKAFQQTISCKMIKLSELLRRLEICFECLAYEENGLEKNLLEKQKRLEKKGIRCYNFTFPLLRDVNNLTNKEKILLEESADTILGPAIVKDPDFYQSFFEKYNSVEQILELFPPNMGIVQRGRLKFLCDYQGSRVNIIQGYRYTTDAPKRHMHSVYLFGKSQLYGYGAEDSDTIASNLQRILNSAFPDIYQVYNRAVSAVSDYECLQHLKEEEMEPGDIVIYMHTKRRCLHSYCQIPDGYVGLTDIFEENTRTEEMFLDSLPHFNYRANQMIAEKVYDTMKEDLGIHQKEAAGKRKRERMHDFDKEKELLKYLEKIRPYRKENGKNGAIIMNCNPFTLGHQYLIETVAKQVSHLYILVVEEDKSRFAFKDRLKLVEQGTKHIENVTVLPGGSFVISSLTFPEYFTKEKEKDIIIDPSLDIEVFASYIAKTLDIRVRFAGEEPLDPITRQYNETMARLLPEYGIEFVELKRKESGEQVISASRVRKLMDEDNYEELQKLVPETTLEYLLNIRK